MSKRHRGGGAVPTISEPLVSTSPRADRSVADSYSDKIDVRTETVSKARRESGPDDSSGDS